MQKPSNRIVKSKPTEDQRAAFYIAIQQGASIRKASDLIGINRNTGMQWARQAKVRRAEQQARKALIASKTEIAAKLTEIALHQPDVAPRDQVNAVAALSKVMGYDAPTVTRHEVIIGTYDQYLALLEQRERLAAAGGEPPKLAASSSLTHSPNISKNSESGEK